eukprot:CAMPEP_0114262764 /NCGR_PEP_ID=MMETSP0058-20121206/22027_1 /TAXON_ID=36894 /ORGANISM="Pyramimonas parkeae, CCMP726" /LENGTH=90 /DNA_ID=CAMNT_0001378753 /DNA_START=80 /DNA_END=348 /DNA_ORIENTATION=-
MHEIVELVKAGTPRAQQYRVSVEYKLSSVAYGISHAAGGATCERTWASRRSQLIKNGWARSPKCDNCAVAVHQRGEATEAQPRSRRILLG